MKFRDYKQLFIEYQKPFDFQREFKDEKYIIIVNPFEYNHEMYLNSFGTQFFDVLNNEHLSNKGIIYKNWCRILKTIKK